MQKGLRRLFAGLILLAALQLGRQSFLPAAGAGLLAAALLAMVAFVAAAAGRAALGVLRLQFLGETEKTVLGATLGLGLLSQGIFLLGVLGWLRSWTACALLGAFLAAGLREAEGLLGSLAALGRSLRGRPLAAAALLSALALSFWTTWVPPHQYDALVYHLPLAAAYARTGSILPVENLLYTHFPQNGEMLYTLALLLGSDLLAQMFTWLGAALSVCWIAEFGRRELGGGAALLAALLTATHTAVMLLSATAYVECLVMLWVTASVLSFLRSRAGETPGWLALSGIFAGLGLGTKYYAGITPALLAACLAARWLKSRDRDRLRSLALFCGCACAFGAPWLVKNILTVGNPVFPFLYRWLPARGVSWTTAGAPRYFELLTEYTSHRGHILRDLARFPFLVASGSTVFGGGADVLGDLGWGLLIAALPAAVWAAARHRALRWVLAYCLGHWAVWYATGTVLRFLVVLVPLWSLLTARGLLELRESLSKGGRIALGAGAAGITLVNLGLFLFVHCTVDSPQVLLGLQSRQQYLSSLLDYYPCARYARENLPLDRKVLVVGEQRGYYVAQPHLTTTVMAPNEFVGLANASADAAELVKRLKDDGGFSYLLLVPRESRRLGEGYGVFSFTDAGYANWKGLEEGRVSQLFDSPGRCAVYRIN